MKKSLLLNPKERNVLCTSGLKGREKIEPMSSMALLKLLMIPALSLSSFGIYFLLGSTRDAEWTDKPARATRNVTMFPLQKKRREKKACDLFFLEHDEQSRAEQPPLTRRFVPPLSFLFSPQNRVIRVLPFFPWAPNAWGSSAEVSEEALIG